MICGPGRILTKVQTTTRRDHVSPEVWTQIGKSESRETGRKNEKPKLDNAPRLTRIYFIDLDDQDYKETLKHARRKCERPVAPAMLCKKKAQTGITKVVAKQEIASQKIPKTTYGCTVEPHECTRQRVETSVPTKHEEHIAGKSFTSMSHYSLVHKFMPCASSNEDSRCRSCSGQGMVKARGNSIMATGTSQKQEGGYPRSTTRQKKKSTLLH